MENREEFLADLRPNFLTGIAVDASFLSKIAEQTIALDTSRFLKIAEQISDTSLLTKAAAEGLAVDTSAFAKIAEQIVESQNALASAVLSATTFVDPALLDLSQSVKDGVRALAARGWTIQMSLTFADLQELASRTQDEIDEFFVAFYTDDNFAELRRVREDLARRPQLARWQPLLDQCFESFESGRHLITVPILLLVIEGVIASAGQALTSQRVRLVGICAANAKHRDNSIRAEMWTSMALFLERLFQRAPFDGANPGFINRHWILHGRDSGPWTVADSLRLFNALQTVDSLLE